MSRAVLDDEKFMYIKEPAPADTYECESECIASELAELFGLKHAEYKLGKFLLNDDEVKVCYSTDYKHDLNRRIVQVKSVAKSIQFEGERGKEKYERVLKELEDLNDAVWTKFDMNSTFKDVNPQYMLFDVGEEKDV